MKLTFDLTDELLLLSVTRVSCPTVDVAALRSNAKARAQLLVVSRGFEDVTRVVPVGERYVLICHGKLFRSLQFVRTSAELNKVSLYQQPLYVH